MKSINLRKSALKAVFNYFSIVIVFSLCLSASPVKKHKKPTAISIYWANGTNFYGSLNMTGATNLNATLYPTTSGFAGYVGPGTYTITLSTGQTGSHQYLFTGAPTQVSSSGSVTWYNVNVTANSTASIY